MTKTALTDPDNFGWIEVDDTGLSEVDAYGFLSAIENERTSAFTASANPAAHTGAMIALVPSQADLARLAQDGGEDLEDLHLTLAYLGEADRIDEETRSRIIDAAGQYFTDVFHTEAFSVNVFNPHNPDMETALVLGVKGEDLVGPRSNAVSAVRGFFDMPANHEPWIPHVTLAYTDDVRRVGDLTAALGPITFDTLRFAFGGENTDIPLYAGEQVEVLAAGFFREKDHPRDKGGQFTEGTGRFADAISTVAGVEKATPITDANLSYGDKIGSTTGAAVKEGIANSTTGISRHLNAELRRTGGKVGKIEGTKSAKSPTSVGSDVNLQKGVRALDEAMGVSKTREDVVVQRGIRDPQLVFGKKWDANGDNAGLSWRDDSFVSTTADSKYINDYVDTEASGFVKMRILVPKGTGAVHVTTTDFDSGQSLPQLLLNRGLKYKIVRDHGNQNGVRQIDVEVV